MLSPSYWQAIAPVKIIHKEGSLKLYLYWNFQRMVRRRPWQLGPEGAARLPRRAGALADWNRIFIEYPWYKWFRYPIHMTFQNICDLDILCMWHFKIFVEKSIYIYDKDIYHSKLFAFGISMSNLWYIYIWHHNFFQIGYPCHNPSIWQMCKRCEWVWVSRWVLQTFKFAYW